MNKIDSKIKDTDHKVEFWINNPSILFNKNFMFDIWPKQNMTREEKVNSISRFVIYITFISVFLFRSIKICVTGIITLIVLILTYYIITNKFKKASIKSLKESFSNEALYQKFKHNYTNPTTQNPCMNIMLPEIQDNPNRLPAAPSYNKAVEKEINESTQNIVKKNFDDENIDKKLFNDLGDKFQFEQSMRHFYSMPNTRIPNNQKEFANFCYGNMASCKDGDIEMCLKSTYRHTNI